MIGEIKKPKTQQELIRSLQTKSKFEFEVIEVTSTSDRSKVTGLIDKMRTKGPVSVIVVR